MAFRRPRFKAIANLDARRKTRDTDTEKILKKEDINSEKDEKDPFKKCEISDIKQNSNSNVGENNIISINEKSTEKECNTPTSLSHVNEYISTTKTQVIETESKDSLNETFKCPPLLGKAITTSIVENENPSGSTFSGSVNTSVLTPTKPRQRIRPMPFFTNRRNSIQGGLSETEEEPPRRTRYPSYSENVPNISNRRRTESACSNISDNYSSRESKIRKMSTTATVTAEECNNVRSNFRKEAIKRSRKCPEKSTLKMMDFIYYNPSKNPMVQNSNKTEELEKYKQEEIKENSSENEDEITEKEEDINSTDNSGVPAPQLKLGPNGEIILDEKSLVIETTGKKEAQKALQRSDVIYLDENTGSNGFYKRQKRTKDWSFEETIKFYRCLQAVGTDFSFMLTLFPNRTRRDLKLKFKKEERRNLALIDKALMNPKLFNIDELKTDLEKEEKEAEEKRKKWNELKKIPLVTNKKKHLPCTVSRGERSLQNGNLAYINEHVLVKYQKTSRKKGNNRKHNDHESLDELHIASPNSGQITHELSKDKKVLPDLNVSNLNESQEEFQNNLKDDFEEILTNFKVEEQKMDHDYRVPIFGKSTNLKNEEIVAGKSDDNNSMDETNSKYQNIQKVLEDLQNGTLVIVASEYSNLPNKIINEIYVMCKETGELSDEPLDLPQEVTECIISEVMN